MIGKAEMMPLLLEACPSLAAAYEAFLEDWPDGEPPLYVALGELARHLTGMLERGETASFPRAFALLERLQVEGEPWVDEAICIGLLEDLQNPGLHSGRTRPEEIRGFLGPKSTTFWDGLMRFWNGHAGE